MFVGCQLEGRDCFFLSLDRLLVGYGECAQFTLKQHEFLMGTKHHFFLLFLLKHDTSLDRLIIIPISTQQWNKVYGRAGRVEDGPVKKSIILFKMLLVQKRDEISMNQQPRVEPGQSLETYSLLLTHTKHNQNQVRTLLGLYRGQLPSYAYLQEETLKRLQWHFQRRQKIVAAMSQQRENNEKILLCQCRDKEEWIKDAGILIKTFDGRVDQAYLLSLPEQKREEYLVFVAGECIAELQWEQALPLLLKLASLHNKMKTPAFYLSMVVLAATANPTLQQRLQDAFLLESQLEQLVFEEMGNAGIEMSKKLQVCKRDSTDLYDLRKQAMQLIKEIQTKNLLVASGCKKLTKEQQGQLQKRKKALQEILRKNLNNDDGLPWAYLLDAMAHNGNHFPRSEGDTQKMLECLASFDRRQGANTIRKKFQLCKLYATTFKLPQDHLEALHRYMDEQPQPQQSHSELVRNALKRREKEAEDIRDLLNDRPRKPPTPLTNPQNHQQFKEQNVLDEPKLKLKQSPIFWRQKGKEKNESHEGKDYEEWRVDRIKEEPKREALFEAKEEMPLRGSQLEKRRKQLAQGVGLMTFYWQNESGQELKTVQGTGFLISGQVVVTAKHNFYHQSQKQKDKKVRCSGCTIQFSNPSDPLNSITYHSKPSNQWFQSQQLDVGAVFLEQPVRHFRGNIRLPTRNDVLQLRLRDQLMVMGYSLQNREATMPDRLNQLSSFLLNIKQHHIQYSSNTLGGHSGSPVFSKFVGRQCLVMGVHTSRKIQGDVCRAVFINERIASQISAWSKQILAQQIYLPQSFQVLSDSVINDLKMYKQEVLLVNRDANFPQVMETLRQKVLLRGGNRKVMEEISCKLLPLLQDRDIEQFYTRLYTKDGVVEARNELTRLGFQQPPPIPAYELAEFRQPQNKAQLYRQKKQSWQQAEEECSQIVISVKSSLASTKSENGNSEQDMDQYDDEESCISQSSEKEEELEESEQQESLCFTEELKLLITYKPHDYIPRESSYLSFLRMRRVATQATIAHLSCLESVFLGRQRVGRVDRWELGVVAEKGWEDWQWVSLLKQNKGLLLLLIRDMVSMVMELQQRQIYLANLQKRNMVLYCLQPTKYSETVPEECLHDLTQLRFKFVNFENTLCLANEQTSKPAFNMIALGRKLEGNEYMEMQPITPMLCERGRDSLQHRFKEEYSSSLASQISYLVDYEGTRLLSVSDRECLQVLCRQQKYPQIVSFLDKAIAGLQ